MAKKLSVFKLRELALNRALKRHQDVSKKLEATVNRKNKSIKELEKLLENFN